jgi:endonuclease-3
MRKPFGPSERCGVNRAVKIASSLSLVAGVMKGLLGTRLGAGDASEYNRAMAQIKLSPKARTEAIFERLAAASPAPQTELEYANPFTLLVAVVLSAQATDVGVNKATRGLFSTVDTPRQMVALGEAALLEKIKSIGLYKTKAKNVIGLSEALIRDHGGEVPNDRDALEALPGVGRKTANVVLNVAFAAPTLAVDTHVFRVSNRIPLAKGKTPREVEDGLMKIIPARFMSHAHNWLILHGRYICTARSPKCGACPIADLCKFPDKTVLGATPVIPTNAGD